MAQEQSAGVLGSGIPLSMRDRPFPLRALSSLSRFMRTKPLGAFGLVLIVVLLMMAVLANVIDRVDPDAIVREPAKNCTPEQVEDRSVECFSPELLAQAQSDATLRLRYPASRFQEGSGGGNVVTNAGSSSDHWLGTDGRGRDLYSRIIHGSRLALLVGIGGAVIAVFLGTIFGVVSAYFGGWVDFCMQRVTDALFAFPSLIFLLVFSQVVPDPNKYWITFALGILGVASVTRLARSAVLSTREEVYVLAAETVGASNLRIMLRHILPNIVAPLIVIFTISIGAYILAEAGLAFIGLGDPAAISWGQMVNEGRQLGTARPQMALYVGLAITLTVLGFNLLGDALRDVLDPRMRGRSGRAGF
ncbi:MAG: ABC transporter permease [Dehalococcoidia bacterium]|nr:ABC transporter permease [Dehalococcoidia bacterium]